MGKDRITCQESFLIRRTANNVKALCLSVTMSLFAGFSYANENVSHDVNDAISQDVKQSRIIRGQVLDETGTPLIGVSVLIKGTSVGTVTDLDGNFTLDIPSNSNTLEVSYIGYITKTITVGNNRELNIQLEPDTQALDEVVVIGYGTMKKRDLTGAVSSVKSSDITLSPSSNPMAALQGRVAGLDITQTSGQAGAGVNMQLRGTRSFSASGNPMFIIDGMPGDYTTLNPNDIESIEVLKDASSTAVYGSQGANGVIIITTKKGNAGKMCVNLNIYGGFNGWSKLPSRRMGTSYVYVLR